MSRTKKVAFLATPAILLAVIAGGLTAGTASAAAPAPTPPPPTSNIAISTLPASTQARIAQLQAEGVAIASISSSQYTTAPPAAPGVISPMGYGLSPCYLTVIVEYIFGVSGPTGHGVQNESLTGCTKGAASSTTHDMDVYKRDLVFGNVNVVASRDETTGYGGSDTSVTYLCPTLNRSGFMAVTAGVIHYDGSEYYANGEDGYYNYDCG